jgi:hypothetical protein
VNMNLRELSENQPYNCPRSPNPSLQMDNLNAPLGNGQRHER